MSTIGALKSRVRELERKLGMLEPQKTKGIALSKTTRGVIRRPLAKSSRSSDEDIAPRWA